MTLTVTASRTVPHNVDEVWRVLSDHELYATVASSLSRVEILDGEGRGMMRRCTDTRGRSWEETCDLWEDGHRFGMEVDTSTYPTDLRLLLRRFRGEWAVEPDVDGARIIVRFEGNLRWGLIGRALARLMRPRAQRLADDVVAGYEAVLSGRRVQD